VVDCPTNITGEQTRYLKASARCVGQGLTDLPNQLSLVLSKSSLGQDQTLLLAYCLQRVVPFASQPDSF
jgi:hypothetical protein